MIIIKKRSSARAELGIVGEVALKVPAVFSDFKYILLCLEMVLLINMRVSQSEKLLNT